MAELAGDRAQRDRTRAGIVAGLAWLAAAGCATATTTATTTPESTGAPASDSPIPEQASNKQAGETLELTIPRFEGGTLELAELRGRIVVLELSASWEPGWASMHAAYPGLLERVGSDQVAVVLVSLDPDTAAIEQDVADAGGGSEAVIRGWDPMGAVAAKLHVATFPTVFVLDAEGNIVEIFNAYDEGMIGRVEASVERARGGS